MSQHLSVSFEVDAAKVVECFASLIARSEILVPCALASVKEQPGKRRKDAFLAGDGFHAVGRFTDRCVVTFASASDDIRAAFQELVRRGEHGAPCWQQIGPRELWDGRANLTGFMGARLSGQDLDAWRAWIGSGQTPGRMEITGALPVLVGENSDDLVDRAFRELYPLSGDYRPLVEVSAWDGPNSRSPMTKVWLSTSSLLWANCAPSTPTRFALPQSRLTRETAEFNLDILAAVVESLLASFAGRLQDVRMLICGYWYLHSRDLIRTALAGLVPSDRIEERVQ